MNKGNIVPKEEKFYSRQEIANLFNQSPFTIDRWRREGHITGYMVGVVGHVKYKLTEVEQAMIAVD